MAEPDTPEFSCIVDVRRLADAPAQLAIGAAEAQRLANRFAVEKIERAVADITYRSDGEAVHLEGHLSAEVTQNCVITLEPFVTRIDQPFHIRFEPSTDEQGRLSREAEEDDGFALDEEDCDTMFFTEGHFDIGEAIAQTLALALDPFPRGPNADAAASRHGLVTEVPKDSPFAVLAQLKKDGE